MNPADPNDHETQLVVAAYERTKKVQPTSPGGDLPATFWPGIAAEFTAAWPTNPSRIIIASELGAGPLPQTTFGTDWKLYFQNDESQPGFKPNDEHTRIANNRLGIRTVMPLRSDLGVKSLPYVLVAHTAPATSRAAIGVFQGLATDLANPGFRRTVTAGNPVLPPAPLSSEALSPLITDDSILDSTPASLRFLHKDRKGQMWAKAAGHDGLSNGVVKARFYYLAQESDFFTPAYPRPSNGSVPWLDLAAGTPGIPIDTLVTTVWPSNEPVLAIPDSLVDAKRGLPVIGVPPNPDGTPGVGGPCSVTVLYDQANAGDTNWVAALEGLAGAARTNLTFDTSDSSRTLLALSAGKATGSGWVTLAMQDRTEPLCNPDAPVSLHVFRVRGPYRGEVATLLAPDAFDERITFKQKADFAGDPDAWHFEWRLQAVGTSDAPAPVKPTEPVEGWNLVDSGPARSPTPSAVHRRSRSRTTA